jgi:hypothetical protein
VTSIGAILFATTSESRVVMRQIAGLVVEKAKAGRKRASLDAYPLPKRPATSRLRSRRRNLRGCVAIGHDGGPVQAQDATKFFFKNGLDSAKLELRDGLFSTAFAAVWTPGSGEQYLRLGTFVNELEGCVRRSRRFSRRCRMRSRLAPM